MRKTILLGGALLLMGATLTADGGQVSLLMDDSGGAGGGFASFTYAGTDHLADGYFSIVEDAFNFVVDGHRAPVDWATSIPIAPATPVAGGTAATAARFYDPQFVSWRVDQTSTTWATGALSRAVVLEYVMANTWSGGTIGPIYPAVWFDFDANGTPIDAGSWDAANGIAYQFDAGGKYVGAALVGGTPWAVRFRSGGLPATDVLEEATVLAGGIDASISGQNLATGLAVGPFTVATGQSVSFRIVVVAGDSLADLQAAVDEARTAFAGLPTGLVAAGPDDGIDHGAGDGIGPGCSASAGNGGILGWVILIAAIATLGRWAASASGSR